MVVLDGRCTTAMAATEFQQWRNHLTTPFSLHARSISLLSTATDLAKRNGGTNGGDSGWA
ncbi:hypothetical protein AHAS_Ahas17G0187500 [Arachis hypogaea]